jgi:hypothetical protein
MAVVVAALPPSDLQRPAVKEIVRDTIINLNKA